MTQPNLDDADPGRLECGKREREREREREERGKGTNSPSARQFFFLPSFLSRGRFPSSSLSSSHHSISQETVARRTSCCAARGAARLGTAVGRAKRSEFQSVFSFFGIFFFLSFAPQKKKKKNSTSLSLFSLPQTPLLVPLAFPPGRLQEQRLRRRHRGERAQVRDVAA